MTLLDERDIEREEAKKKKMMQLIVRVIIALIVIAFILMIYVFIKDKATYKIVLNGNTMEDIDSSMILKDNSGKVIQEDGQVYISVIKLSELLQNQYYNSEYKVKGEDKSKCMIRANNQYTSLIAKSNKVYKAIVNTVDEDENENNGTKIKLNNNENKDKPQNNQVDYEYFTLTTDIKIINNEIFASEDAIELAFDVSISYEAKNKKLNIYTLEHLEKLAKNARKDAVSSSEYDYINRRLLKYGMTIVRDQDGNLGVGSYTDKDKLTAFVASCKYTSIKFNEGAKTLEVVTNGDKKSCVLKLNLENQSVEKSIVSQYKEMRSADNDYNYFIVKENDKYGMINSDGKVIIYPLYEDIGVDENKFTGIESKYILNNKYVPVKQNALWGLYSVDGKKLIDPKYFEVGCGTAQNGEYAVMIPNAKDGMDAIVFQYNKEQKLYGVYKADNGEKIAISLMEVFKKLEDGQDKYYMNYVIDKANSVIHTINIGQ